MKKTEKAVLELLDKVQKYSKSKIAEKAGKSQSTVQRAIKRLIELGLIKRIGSNKTGSPLEPMIRLFQGGSSLCKKVPKPRSRNGFGAFSCMFE